MTPTPWKQLLWRSLGRPLFHATFHDWYALRRAILRAFGASIADSAIVRPSVSIDAPWALSLAPHATLGDHAVVSGSAPVSLGIAATVSQYAHLCTASRDPRTLAPTSRPIRIADHAWVAAEAFVAPGVTLHDGAILGARSTATHDLEPWTIHAGHPARPLKPRPRPLDLHD